MIDKDIALTFSIALALQKVPAHVQIMNARMTPKCKIRTITDQNTTADMARLSRDIIIKAGRLVDK
jgi:hypothetical protein